MFSVLKHVPLCCEQMVDQRGVVAAEEVLPEALKRAASAAGVSPRTSLEGIAVGGGRGGGGAQLKNGRRGGRSQEWPERGRLSGIRLHDFFFHFWLYFENIGTLAF